MAKIPRTKDVPDYPILDAGWYTLTVIDIQEKVDKNGDVYLNVEFSIEDKAKKVWDNFYHQREDRLWKLKNFLKQIDESFLDEEFDSGKLIGKQIVAHIIPEKVGNKIWERIKEYVALSEASPENLNDKDLPF